ncbi:hypothetical protein BpHYR1_031475 [Brachionus plicatilis]|uniref:Uncharacterized protein n=1 Tax=Brachionus plicatilis TaxID=10195 RepID=A0A3M7PIY8_BRAPC|nr:hypothetical protein BpHYR1_031475 [Brachionus plicatilis]
MIVSILKLDLKLQLPFIKRSKITGGQKTEKVVEVVEFLNLFFFAAKLTGQMTARLFLTGSLNGPKIWPPVWPPKWPPYFGRVRTGQAWPPPNTKKNTVPKFASFLQIHKMTLSTIKKTCANQKKKEKNIFEMADILRFYSKILNE